MFRRDNEKRCRDISWDEAVLVHVETETSLYWFYLFHLFVWYHYQKIRPFCFEMENKSLSMKTLRIKTLGLSSPFSPFFSQVEEGMMASWQVRPAEWMLTKRWDLCWI